MSNPTPPKWLEFIESKPELALALVKHQHDFRQLLLYIQLGLVNNENKESAGYTLFAFKEIYDKFDATIVFGESLIEKEQKKKELKKKKTDE